MQLLNWKNRMKKRFTIALFSIIFFISYSHSNEINVTSERLEIDREKRTSTFYGSVYFYNNDMEVWADKVIISFDDNDDKIKEIFAENNVKIIRNDLIVTGTKGFYNPLSENIKIKKLSSQYAKVKKICEDIVLSRNIDRDLCLRLPGIFSKKRKAGIISELMKKVHNRDYNVKFFEELIYSDKKIYEEKNTKADEISNILTFFSNSS